MRNGGYSVTMRHERIKHDGARGVVRHAIRSVEESNGIRRKHANKNIDAARTGENQVWIYDGNGGFVEAQTPAQIHDYREELLSQRKDKRKIRKDQITMMETVLQLDNEFTGSAAEYLADAHGTAEQTAHLLNVLTDYVVEKVGAKNVNYIALHVDETSPHVQIGWTPLADDGSLDFRKILGETRQWKDGRMRGTLTPKMMADQHEEVRQLMNDHGYPAVEVFAAPRHEKNEVFKRQQELLDSKFVERETAVKLREDQVEFDEKRVAKRYSRVEADKQQLKDDRAAFEQEKAQQQRANDDQQRQFATQQQQVAAQQRDLDEREKQLDEREKQMAVDAAEAERQRKEQLDNERETLRKEIDNERATMLADVEQREQDVAVREELQQKVKQAANTFMDTRVYRNAMKYPMDMPAEEVQFANAVSQLYLDVKTPPHSYLELQGRGPMKKGGTDTRLKSRTPTPAEKARKKAEAKKLSEQVDENIRKKKQGGNGSPDY